MEIDFYTGFYKKSNSTLQPTTGGIGNLTEKHTVTGHLKEPCSVLHPVVSLQNTPVTSSIPAICTYAYIALFSRYYFINDWTWEDGLWSAHMDIDVLASWKNEIGELSEYVLRADTTTDFNTYISDAVYPATNDFSIDAYSMQSAFSDVLSSGCYIVGIISGASASTVGAISYYAMTATEFGNLKSKLFSNDNLEIMGIIDSGGTQLVTDLSQEVLKTMYNPYQYIVSCMWFPFGKSALTYTQTTTGIKIGWWNYPSLEGGLLSQQIVEFGESGSLPEHPLANTRGEYLNYSPYTRRTLIGRFGTVAVDTSYFKLGNNISIGYFVDLITGQCRATIEIYPTGTNPTHTIIAERQFLLAVPIQIAQVGTDYIGTAVSAVNSVSSTLSGALSGALAGGIPGAIAGGLTNAVNGVYNTLNSAMPQVETAGCNGSFLAPSTHTILLSQFFNIIEENITHKGRPVCDFKTIKNLSGYILCADSDVELNCYDEERDMIGTYLTSGFFWE